MICEGIAGLGLVITIISMAIILLGTQANIPDWLLGISFLAVFPSFILMVVGLVIRDRRAVSLASPEKIAELEAQKTNEPSFARQVFRLFFD